MQSAVGAETLSAKSGGSTYLSLQGRLREALAAGQTFTVDLGTITAGGTADVQLREAVSEDNPGAAGTILVKVPSESGFTSFVAFSSFFRPNNGQPAGITDSATPRRAYRADPNAPEIDSTVVFGLIEAGSNVKIEGADSSPPDGDTKICRLVASFGSTR